LKNIIAFLFFLVLLSISLNVEAHPGRTDANGGHTCKTNCEKYGLEYGEYHYHNGGGGSTNPSSTPAQTPTIQSNDKDCGEFASYDEVVQYWNEKGYSATNDPENLDGWGNGQVDDGIPCEPPSGYDFTKINNSPEQIAEKTAKQEKEKGEADGYPDGVEAGYHDGSQTANPTGSEAYVEGYKAGYSKGWEEGNKKFTSEKEKAEKAGNELGKKQDKLTIPKDYSQNDAVKASFEKGFIRAVTERDEAKKKEFNQKGYEEGKRDEYNVPTKEKEAYIKAYEEGYKKGQAELKESYVKQGYESAYTIVTYSEPKLEDQKYIDWYKEGFESNKEVDEIVSEAYALGLAGNTYNLPGKYKHAEKIFKHHYELGWQKYEEEKAENTNQAAAGVGIVVLAWVGRRFYVAKKMVG